MAESKSLQKTNLNSLFFPVTPSELRLIIDNTMVIPPNYLVLHNKTNFLGIKPKDLEDCLLYTSPSPRDATLSRMPSSA